MFSLQQLFGRGDRFFTLLEGAAVEAHDSVQHLLNLLKTPRKAENLDALILARRKEKKISEQISKELVETFITGLEREDIDALSRALYKIPKSVEKFAERFSLGAAQLADADFTPQAQLMERATDVVLAMVRQLREIQQIEKVKDLNDRLQYLEGEADKLMLDLLRDLYSGRHDTVKILMLKDCYELLEKIIDRCRDAGNVILNIVLKNA